MTRARVGSWILGVAVLLLFVTRTTSALGPAFIVIHGGPLQAPIVIRPGEGRLMFMWQAGNVYERIRPENMTIPAGLQDRRYLDYDVYWGNFTPEDLKPEAASQHGRLYLQTPTEPPAVVTTEPYMISADPNAKRADATPIPSGLGGFASGRALSTDEASALVAAGVPVK